LLGCNRRYLEYLSSLDDFSAGIRALDRLTQPRPVKGRNVRGLNFFSRAEQTLLSALLANIVMAWNTHQLQIAIDRAPADYPDEVLSRIAPIGYKHINLRGILTFDLTRLGPSLLGRQPGDTEKRASS